MRSVEPDPQRFVSLPHMKKVGILGGGQLGRMLLQAAANYPVETYVLENDDTCPAAHLCHHFTKGDIRDEATVYNFAKKLDALTIEIESVNVEALEKLEKKGVKIYPSPAALRIINNKALQKQFYKENHIRTADFILVKDKKEILDNLHFLPAVNKLATGGYDGKGVQLICDIAEAEKAFDAPGVLEKMVHIHKELSLIVAVGDDGDSVIYPPVDMVFDPDLNLLDFQLCPADIPENTLWKAEALARAVVKGLKSPGIFAVEMFIDTNGDVFVNETAPRVHNSGHHTIEGNGSSQFDMLWRILLNYPLGNTDCIRPSALVNLIGADGHKGPARYEGLHDILSMENVFVHLYGKKMTQPGRKMGHVTILSDNRIDLVHKAHKIKHALKVFSEKNVQ